MASSNVIASPHIPAHLEGCRHPLGGAAGVADVLKLENDIAPRWRCPVAVEDDSAAAAEDMQVRGFVCVAFGCDKRDVWQQSSAGEGTGKFDNRGEGWTVCNLVLTTSNGVTDR
jgi:hypothetical protein